MVTKGGFMHMVFAGAIYYLIDTDVRYSPCGRELDLGDQLANLGYQYPKTINKIVTVVLTCFSLLMLASACYVGFTHKVTLNLSTLVSDMVNELCFMVFIYLPVFISSMSLCNWINAIRLQKEESELIGALGGQAAFDHLPSIYDIKDEKELCHLEPSDVRHQPITKGFLADGRFFLALQIQERLPHQQLPVMTILCQKKWTILNFLNRGKLWEVLGHQKVALGRGHFIHNIDNLQILILRTHFTHELV